MADDTANSLGDQLLDIVSRYRLSPFQWPAAAALRRLYGTQPWQVFVTSALAGICGTAVVALLSTSPKDLARTDVLVRTGLLFVIALLLYRHLQRAVLRTTSAAVEQALHAQRVRVAGKIAALDLRGFEDLPKSQLYGGLARHYATISDSTVGVLQGIQSLVMLLLVLLFLASVSITAAILSTVVFALAAYAYRGMLTEQEARLKAASQADAALVVSLNELLDGFRELCLDFAKRAAVLEEIRTYSGRSTDERSAVSALLSDATVFGNSVAYLLAGTMVFLVPLFGPDNSAESSRLVAVVLFMIAPVGALVGAANQLATARFAIKSLFAFEAEIDALLRAGPKVKDVVLERFESLEAHAVRYTHRMQHDDIAFSVGPLDFRITAGEIVFVTGGNGSGKTTAMEVLTGLYPPAGGEMLLNGMPLAPDGSDSDSLRQLFGAVFADVHVFRKLYALPPERVGQLQQTLLDFGIAHKLPGNLEEGFDPTALSTGQRKRLALAIALVEDRPILVLDEWAADQDPQSRDSFYRQVLPRLRVAGKAVVAITHDDRYFGVADRRYHMEEGRMTLVARP